MKLFKNLLLFLLFVCIATFMLSFFAPANQKVEKSILINASPAEVYAQMMMLQNFRKWSIWGNVDSSIQYTANGEDGVVGSILQWTGDPALSGKGEIMITELKPNQLIMHDLNLLEPQPLKAHSKFIISPVGNQTEVKWIFVIPSKRPFNIFNMFFNLEKEKGKDFEAGLRALKILIEKQPIQDSKSLSIQRTMFPATNYAAIRQTVLWVDYPVFFQQHFDHLKHYVLNGKNTLPTRLIFNDNDSLHQSTVAAALPLPSGFQPQLNVPEELIKIPASPSVEVTFTGEENIKQQAYKTLNDYLVKNNLKSKKPVIEQYLTNDSLPTVKIIYLVQ
ncbi:MAG: SRPBCC family protein [Niabella sp.]